MKPLYDWLLLMPVWMLIAGKQRLVLRAIDEEKGIDRTKVIYLDPAVKDDKELIEILDEIEAKAK